ncbi:MAG: hypothetical protein LBD12_02415, partial [Clostridiales Family XIII bacterium]|jgi:hypothetical protein|nr:hypothetical protein [Clostridiales Family XIII bacterium]
VYGGEPETAFREYRYSDILQWTAFAWESPEMGHDLIVIFKRADLLGRKARWRESKATAPAPSPG